jgi:hypothetical protein
MAMDFNTPAGKLANLRERGSEDTISRPVSLASTSSAAFHFADKLRTATGRTEKITHDDALEDKLQRYWATKGPRRERVWRDQEAEAMNEAKARKDDKLFPRGPCDAYAQEAASLSQRRAEEDLTGDHFSRPARPISWAEHNRLAVEYQRREEDYHQMQERLSVWTTDDVKLKTETEEAQQIRVPYIKALMSVYDSQWKASAKRFQENQIPHSPEQDPEEGDVEEQKAGRGRPRGRAKREHVEPTDDSENHRNGDDVLGLDERGPPRRGLRKTERATAADDAVPDMNGRGPPRRGRPKSKRVEPTVRSTGSVAQSGKVDEVDEVAAAEHFGFHDSASKYPCGGTNSRLLRLNIKQVDHGIEIRPSSSVLLLLGRRRVPWLVEHTCILVNQLRSQGLPQ